MSRLCETPGPARRVEQEARKGETVWDAYLRRRKEKRKEKKLKVRLRWAFGACEAWTGWGGGQV